jgi:hypothetical protein
MSGIYPEKWMAQRCNKSRKFKAKEKVNSLAA